MDAVAAVEDSLTASGGRWSLWKRGRERWAAVELGKSGKWVGTTRQSGAGSRALTLDQMRRGL